MRIALFQPEIAGNVGAVLRLGACLGLPVDVIEPCGFAFSDRAMARAGMDYAERHAAVRHADWDAFLGARRGRLLLFTTKSAVRLPEVAFEADDVLLFGSESSGAPAHVHEAADVRVRIPIAGDARSLNLSTSCAIAAGEALRQTGGWPI
jgi:tRNA (cytidine/uridine-2'-O-)-methyltransferase